jgi:cytoskeleton protein RodZ
MDHSGQNTHAANPTSSDVGTLLCATRMRMGKDLQHIAEILHIRYNYLVAMEDGRYEDLPGQAYAIGFVRAYADHLGLDGDEIVRRYKEESSGLKNRPVFEFPLPTPDSGVPSGVLILIAILLGMAIYGVWYSIAGSDRSAVQVIQDVPDRLTAMIDQPAEAPNVASPADTPAEIATSEKPDDETDLVSDDTETAPAPSSSPTEQQNAPAPQPTEPPEIVELRAKSDVWITLRTAENPDRTQMLHKGEVFQAPEGGGMTLVTAKPTDLEILVNGEVMPPLDEGVFARGVALDPQRLKGGTAAAPDNQPSTSPLVPASSGSPAAPVP